MLVLSDVLLLGWLTLAWEKQEHGERQSHSLLGEALEREGLVRREDPNGPVVQRWREKMKEIEKLQAISISV